MRLLSDLLVDLRFGARLLARNPGFAIAAALSLALGIGGTTAIFSLIDAIVLRALPVAEPSQLYIAEFRAPTGSPSSRLSWLFYDEVRAALAGRAEVCGTSSANRMLVADVNRSGAIGELPRVQLVTGECFSTFRQQAQIGRLLTPADNRTRDAHPVAVISDGFWARQFGRSRDVIGRTFSVNGTLVSVVGVASPQFFGTSIDQKTDIWVPAMMQHSVRYRGNVSIEDGDRQQPWIPQPEISWLTLFLRIQTPEQVPEVTSRLDAVAQRQFARRQSFKIDDEARRRYQAVRAVLEPGDKGLSNLRQRTQSPLTALLVMVSLLLLIACANIAGLLVARAASRQRELAVRVSIGANRGRLVRQLVAESLLLAIVGGAVGLLVARWGADGLLALLTVGGSDSAVAVPMDGRVLGFALATSLLTGLLFGLLPAWRASGVSPAQTLSMMSRSVTRGLGGSSRLPLGRFLVVAQIAITVLLLTMAALFARTLQQVARVDVGFTRGQVLLARLDPVAASYTLERLPAFYRRLIEHVTSAPGVVSASVSLRPPLSGSRRTSSLGVEGYTRARGEQHEVQEEFVSEDYFKTLGLSLAEGRTFGPEDTPTSRKVSVINETMARRFFKGRSPIGQRWAFDDDVSGGFEIVGVVRDARYNDLRGETPNAAYHHAVQSNEYLEGLEVRTSGPAASLAADVRRLVSEVDPRLPILDVTTLDSRVDLQLTQERLLAALTVIFGVVALLLACLGLYGTMAYSIARRTAELGVRIALGATRRDVLFLVLREALVVIAFGLAIGVPMAIWAGGRVDQLLYNVSPLDALSYISATLVLAIVAIAAALVPARRAAALEPMSALRTE
jgi:putative ABC transport system permease protein